MPVLRTFVFFAFALLAFGSQAQSVHVLFQTNYGDFEVELFDNTPKHKELFIQGVTDGFYQEALFNRVVKDFVNQGGELDEPILEEEAKGLRAVQRLGHEILPENIHRRGALGAGRDNNAEKASYYRQIYFVIGKVFTEQELDSLEKKRNITIPTKNREVYMREGGTPHLDGDYTIFGQVIKGMDVIEKINRVPTSPDDMPLDPVVFSVTVLSKKL